MDRMFDEISLEKYLKVHFNLKLEIKSLIIDKLPAGPSTSARVLLSSKGLLFVLIEAKSTMTLGDVKKIVNRMGFKAEQFLPPHADAKYFDRVATRKFNEIFPGRPIVHDHDLNFYRTLVNYNPALVQISEVKNSVIKQYDSDAVGNWRPSVKFAYRRIRTS